MTDLQNIVGQGEKQQHVSFLSYHYFLAGRSRAVRRGKGSASRSDSGQPQCSFSQGIVVGEALR